MDRDWTAENWIARPEFAAGDWPARDLHGHAPQGLIALRVANAENVIGRLTLIAPDGLEIDGMRHVPFGVIRAYTFLEAVVG